MRSVRWICVGMSAAAALAAGWAAAAPAPAPAPAKPAAKPAAPPVPTGPAANRPVINLTATTTEARRAQIRLAGFIYCVQRSDWKKAATYLSRQVTAAERAQLLNGPWLRRTRRNDFAVLFYMPEIDIRTLAFQPPTAKLRLQSRYFEKVRGQAFGIWDIPMVREGNKWMLNIHPDTKTAQAK